MKVTCHICGGILVVDVGSSIAVCMSCGMGYTLEKVREMVGGQGASPPMVKKEGKVQLKEPVKQEVKPVLKPQLKATKKEQETALWEEVKIEPVKIRIRTVVKSGFQSVTLYGVVESGTFDMRDDLYVDDDEQKCCRLGRMTCNDKEIFVAKKDMQVVITVFGTQIKHLKNVKYLTAPAALSGSVEEEVYFMQIITSNFKSLTVKRNVRVSTKEQSVPVSYMLYKNNKPILAIILCSSRVYDLPKIKNTMEACEMQKIPVQRYFTEFENDKEYVINRIKSAL